MGCRKGCIGAMTDGAGEAGTHAHECTERFRLRVTCVSVECEGDDTRTPCKRSQGKIIYEHRELDSPRGVLRT